MILYRYLSRQLFAATVSITGILALILVSGRLIKYMSDAAAGKIAKEVLLTIMLFRLPSFLEMIMPLGLFLAVLLAYGRLYLDREMVVLNACGFGPKRLFAYTALPTICMMIVVGMMSLWLGPLGSAESDELIQNQQSGASFLTLAPGRFHSMRSPSQVTYAKSLSEDKKRMEEVTILQQELDNVSVVVAKRGWRELDPNSGVQYLQLEEGMRYQGLPGKANMSVTRFESYRLKIQDLSRSKVIAEIRAMPTGSLLKQPSSLARAELQWRWSLPLLVPIIVAMAIPLSRVNPRQGRFLKILPSILLYLTYLTLLSSGKSAIETGDLPAWVGLWWVHLIFAAIAFALNYWPVYQLNRRMRLASKI